VEEEFGFSLEQIKEGSARIYVPKRRTLAKGMLRYRPSRSTVFYNPMMSLNRDLAVAVFQAFQKQVGRDISVCEPLGGCGVRSIRFALEVRGIRNIILNDINPLAAKLSLYNVRGNKVEDLIRTTNLNANLLLQKYSGPKKRFDAIDLDPFGSPAPFLDSTISALKDGGLLAATATDTAPLCGVHPWACIRKYGAVPLRTEYCHELAVRILLGMMAVSAGRRDFGIEVLMTHSTDHYVRSYVRVEFGAKKSNESLSKMGYVLHCFDCFHREIARGFTMLPITTCPECGGKLKIAGPLWADKIVNSEFCSSVLSEAKVDSSQSKVSRQLLEKIVSEGEAPPTYYVIDRMCDKFGLPIPKTEEVIEKLREGGYSVAETHFHPKGLKTNAPALAVKNAVAKTSGVTKTG